MATEVPFKWISGLPPEAQREIERNFLHVQKQIVPSATANFIYIACSDATAAEKLQATIQLTGISDDVLINAAFTTYPGATFVFSSGNVNLSAFLSLQEGQRIIGSSTPLLLSPFFVPTTFNALTAASNFGSATDPYVFFANKEGNEVQHAYVAYNATFSSGTVSRNVVNGGSAEAFHQTFKDITIVSAFTHFWTGDAAHSTSYSTFQSIHSQVSALSFNHTSGFTNCVFIDVFNDGTGSTIPQALILSSSFLSCGMASTTPINGNGILPVVSAPPSGAAGGDLTGTYPNPTLIATGPGATGPLGDATHTPVITIDAKGRVTALTSAVITAATTDYDDALAWMGVYS